MNIIFDQEKTDADDLKRLMDYAMQYILVMDQLVDGKDGEPLDEVDYFDEVRPRVLRTIKTISDRGIALQKDNKSRGLFNLNLLDFNFFLLAVQHHLWSNIDMYNEKGKSLLTIDIEQAKKDLEIVNKKLKLIDDGNEAINEKDQS